MQVGDELKGCRGNCGTTKAVALVRTVAASLLLAFTRAAAAQPYPMKPVRLIHGFGVGSAIDVMWDSLAVVRPQMLTGKLRIIGVTGAKRAAALPEVSTIAESGLPGYGKLIRGSGIKIEQ